MQHYHLVKRANLWRLEEEGSDRALFSAATKAEALEQTEEFMNDRRGTVWIHKADGELQDERSYAIEPGTGRRTSGLTWATILTLGITFAAGCALAWHYRQDLGNRLREVDIDRLRALNDRGRAAAANVFERARLPLRR
jgi:hypothetical protein